MNDALPEEPTQHIDGDGDGYGDNAEGVQPDSCPAIAGTSNQQIYGCLDGDGDGWADSTDAYPDDVLLWSDGDQDGYADQQGTDLSDDCPEVFGASTKDALGCPDTDDDGWSNSADAYPEDSTKHEASVLTSGPVLYVGLAVILVVIVLLMWVGRRRGPSPDLEFMAAPLELPVVATPPTGPPLPPEGLPAGWTMDQWAWYGEDYLNNR